MDENAYKPYPTEEGQYRAWIWKWVQDIKSQTTKTNGRVTKIEVEHLPALEKELAALTLSYKLWRARMTGAMAVITALLLPALFILLSHYIRPL